MSLGEAMKLYDRFRGKYVKLHTENLDTIEGIWEDHFCSLNEKENTIMVWWVKIRNGSTIFYVLSEIDVIEVPA